MTRCWYLTIVQRHCCDNSFQFHQGLDDDDIIVWIWFVSHKAMCLNTWSLVGGAVLGGCRTVGSMAWQEEVGCLGHSLRAVSNLAFTLNSFGFLSHKDVSESPAYATTTDRALSRHHTFSTMLDHHVPSELSQNKAFLLYMVFVQYFITAMKKKAANQHMLVRS